MGDIGLTAGRKVESGSIHWNTPESFCKLLDEFFYEGLELDPCTNEYSKVVAKRCVNKEEDGLSLDWGKHSSVFCNPPYGRGIKAWFCKAYKAFCEGSEVVMLVPSSPNTSHWKDYIFEKAACVGFCKASRYKFGMSGDEKNKGAPMCISVIYYGSRKEYFKNIFKKEFNFL